MDTSHLIFSMDYTWSGFGGEVFKNTLTGVIAYSDHEAAIGDESDSCSLTMER